MAIIENVVKAFPKLVVKKSAGGVEIKLTGASSDEDSEVIVGNYTFAAVASGEVSEKDIREDCEAFFEKQ